MNDTILLNQPPLYFEEQISQALKSLREGDLLALGASPLAYTALVEEAFLAGEPLTVDGRGRILRSLLRWGIERLRPEGEPSWVKPAWRTYHILAQFYLEGVRASALAESMAVAEQTLYQLRPTAISALAQILRSEVAAPENGASRRQVVHTDRYGRLSSPEQQLLRLAAIFPGAVPSRLLYGLAATLGNHDAPATTQHLVLQHLLRTDTQVSEFVVQPELRHLLLTRLSPTERQVAHCAAAEHYAAQHNFLEAAHQWRAGDQPERAAQTLIDHHRDIIDNLQVEELTELLTHFRASELAPAWWARLKILAGELAEFTHHTEAALAEYQQALAAPDQQTKALAYYRRAKAFEQLNSDESLAHYARAVYLLERESPTALGGSPLGTQPEAQRLTLLANTYIDRAWLQMQVRTDLDGAERDLLRARALLDQAPTLRDQPIWCDLDNALGEFYHRRGDSAAAVEHCWQAWLAANEVGDRERMSKTAHNLGLVYMDNLRQYDRALEYLHKSEALALQTGNRQMAGLSAMSIGACHYWLGDRQAAIRQYATAATIFTESGSHALLARAHFGLAEAHAELGDGAAARQHHSAGVTIATTLGDQGALQEFAALAQQHHYLATAPQATVSFSPRQQQALAYVRQQGRITNREYQALTGVSQKQTVRDLNELVEAKQLQRKGSGRATYYTIDGSDQQRFLT